jgi:alpha-D-ribose 1-methylphosphonate 5-triphosphate synthase subunit PhnG
MATEPAVSSLPIAQQAVRREAMAVLAASDTEEIDALLAAAGELPAYRELRKPESGLLMLRGRISGDGARGHGDARGGAAGQQRNRIRLRAGARPRQGAAHRAVRCAYQTERYRSVIESRVIEPIRARQSAARKLAAQRTAATRVEFFTLVRGEDTAS